MRLILHKPSRPTVTPWPSGVNAGPLPVSEVSRARDRHHKHDPSAATTTGRWLVASTNAIARPFGEKLGCAGRPHKTTLVQIERAAPVPGATNSSPPPVATTRSPSRPGTAPPAGDAHTLITATATAITNALDPINGVNEPSTPEFRPITPSSHTHHPASRTARHEESSTRWTPPAVHRHSDPVAA